MDRIRLRVRIRVWLPLGALLIFAAGTALFPMTESDLFFRLAAGREILARHAIPSTNLFSFTHPDFPDLDASWLFEVAAAALFRAGGFAGLVIAKAAVVVGIAAAAFWLCRRRGAGPLASALAVAGALAVMRERLVERPHLFSFAGELGVLAALQALAAIDDRARRRWLIAALLAGLVLWANLHAGVFVAPLLLAAYAAGAAIDGRGDDARRAAALAAAACGATLATPLGLGIFRYLWLHMQIPRLHAVDEFRAASWQSDGALAVYALALAVAAVTAATAPGGRARAGFRTWLPVTVLAVLAWRTIRFGADFALVAAPLMAVGASALAARRPFAAALRGPAPAAGVAALLIGLALGPRLADARQGRPFVDVGLDPSPLPLDALRFVEANGLRQRMYNDFEIGSYLAFEGYPRHRVFIDPRLPAYPPEFHRLMGRADLTRAEWDRAMDRYGVDSALLAYAGLNRRVSWWDPARWALVYRQHDARVFVRRLPGWRALIAAHEIPATFTFTVEEGTATEPIPAPPADSPVAPCEWQRRLGDLLLDLDNGGLTRALPAYEAALAAPPGCLAPATEAALRKWLAIVGAPGASGI
jgi:hypothetical protein